MSRKYQTLEEMLQSYKIKNLRSLIRLSDLELNHLISIIKINDGEVALSDLLTNVPDEETKIRIIVDQLSQKLCRCIKKVGAKQRSLAEQNDIAICIQSIFRSKGLTIPKFQCDPMPMLIPKKGTNYVISSINK